MDFAEDLGFADGARQKIELTRHHGVLRKRGKRAG
jgi:hypothetical protein